MTGGVVIWCRLLHLLLVLPLVLIHMKILLIEIHFYFKLCFASSDKIIPSDSRESSQMIKMGILVKSDSSRQVQRYLLSSISRSAQITLNKHLNIKFDFDSVFLFYYI